jgi:hypothetical protein
VPTDGDSVTQDGGDLLPRKLYQPKWESSALEAEKEEVLPPKVENPYWGSICGQEMASRWPQLISPLNTILGDQRAYPYLKRWWRIRDSNP